MAADEYEISNHGSRDGSGGGPGSTPHPCEICDEQSGIGTGFSTSTSVSCQHYATKSIS
jgi:hypothetical protein